MLANLPVTRAVFGRAEPNDDLPRIGLQQDEHMLLGFIFGSVKLVVVLAVGHALAYRDRGPGTCAL